MHFEMSIEDFTKREEWDGIYTIIECRKALGPSRLPGLNYALNPYTGCTHGCVYCYYVKKPEYMCQLFGNRLVYKNHPRIAFRGKLDSMSSTVVQIQAEIAATSGPQKLIDDLGDINKVLNQIMYCEVMDEEMGVMNILGLTPEELRARSHNPQKYFNIKQMLLPNYTMGVDYTKLNVLRAKVRELELAALDCFVDGKNVKQPEIIRTLNRLSSAFHIMMCMYLAGEYK